MNAEARAATRSLAYKVAIATIAFLIAFTLLPILAFAETPNKHEPNAELVVLEETGEATILHPERATYGLSEEAWEKINDQTGNVLFDVSNGTVPIGSAVVKEACSLLSVIMVSIGVFAALALAVLVASEKSQKRRFLSLRFAGILLGILLLVVFYVVEDISLPVVWMNTWTLLIAAVFFLEAGAIASYCIIRKDLIRKRVPRRQHYLTSP